MNPWSSFLQTVFRFVKSMFVSVTKEMHRNTAVLTAGAVLIAVIPFTAVDFQGGGRNAMVAFAETQTPGDETENELETAKEDVLPETEGAVESGAQPAEEESASEENIETDEENEEETEAGIGESEDQDGEEAGEPETADQDGEEAGEAETEGRKAENRTEPETADQVSEEAGAEETEAAKEAFSGYSESDYHVLLRIVQAEAGNCDLKGRILVANVILNRVEDEEFPDTITEVVYEKNQFSPVIDGSIKRCKVTDKTREAVDRALSGEDYSEGALYFMNRRTAAKKNVRWFDRNLESLFQHGNHEFFR